MSAELKLALEETLEVKSYKKNELLIKEGERCKNLYFVKQGALRSYCYDQEKEITTEFYFENDLLTSWFSFFSKEPSIDYIQFLEDAELVVLSRKDLNYLYDQFPELERFTRLTLEEGFALEEYLTKGFLFMTAKKKYELLLSIYPKIEQRVNLGFIASYLGISQETLSRIRGK